MNLVEEQINEMNSRIDQLTTAKQRAKNEFHYGSELDDSKPYDRSYVETLDRKLETAKRELESARSEYEKLHSTQLQLQQSIEAMESRVKGVDVSSMPGVLPNIEISSLPSNHPAAEFVMKLKIVGQKLTWIMAQAARDAVARRPDTSPPGTRGSMRTRADSVFSFNREGQSEDTTEQKEDERQRRVLEQMEDMVAANEWNIRIRPGSAGKKSNMTARQINAAAAAFSAVHARLAGSPHKTTEDSDQLSGKPKRGVRGRRRGPSPKRSPKRSPNAGGSKLSSPPTRTTGFTAGAESGSSPTTSRTPTATSGDGKTAGEDAEMVDLDAIVSDIVADSSQAGGSYIAGSIDGDQNGGSTAAGSVDLSRQASQMRRRNSRVEIMPLTVPSPPDSPDTSPQKHPKAKVRVMKTLKHLELWRVR